MPTGLFGNQEVDNLADLDAATARWQAGGPGTPVFAPAASGGAYMRRDLQQAGFNPTLPNSAAWQQAARTGANAPMRANPFSGAIANQSRGQQLALIEQLRQQMLGPSLAGMQGQGALARSGQAALGAAALGGAGANRGAMMNAQQVGSGLGGDVGQARLAEVMRAQAGMGGVAGGLRSGDLATADSTSRFGNQQLQMDLANRLGYAGLGARQAGIEGAAQNELLRAMQRATLAQHDKELGALKGAMGPLGGILGLFGVGGK